MIRAVSDVAPGLAAGVAVGLGEAKATCAVAKCALLMSAQRTTIIFFKVFFSWLQLD
jgi:hypothetical protein